MPDWIGPETAESGVPQTVLGASHRSIGMMCGVFCVKDVLVSLLGSILADLALSVAEPTLTGVLVT